MSLSRYAVEDLTRFLEALDAALVGPARLVVIGGSALVLGYGGTAATTDIDTYESRSRIIEEAAEAARASTGLNIPIADSGIAQIPADFEERLVRVLRQLQKLQIHVLDRHDLAASKLVRGNEHDRQQLAQLHELVPLDLDTLVVRFKELMRDFVGDPTEPWWALRHLVGELWGELEAADVDVELRRLRNGTITPK
jgi:hypothetical protein